MELLEVLGQFMHYSVIIMTRTALLLMAVKATHMYMYMCIIYMYQDSVFGEFGVSRDASMYMYMYIHVYVHVPNLALGSCT